MLRLHLGSTPHALTDNDWTELAELTGNYSGSDISVVVRDAMMEPIRMLQEATHFKAVEGPDPDDPSVKVYNRLVPCPSHKRGAVRMTMSQIKTPKLVMLLPVTKADFLKALAATRPSVNQEDIEKHAKFRKEFGQ